LVNKKKMKKTELRKLIREEINLIEAGRAVGRFKSHGNNNFDAEEDKSEFPWQMSWDPSRWNDDYFDRAGLKDVVGGLNNIWKKIRSHYIRDGYSIHNMIADLRIINQDLNTVIQYLETNKTK
jgi:hypothetical protein